MKRQDAQRLEKRWWRRQSLTLQAVTILVLAIGPLLISMVMLTINSQQDAALDEEVTKHRVARGLQTSALNELIDAETGVRGYLLTEDPAFLAPYKHALEQIPEHFDQVEEHGRHEKHVSFTETRELAERELRILSQLASQRRPAESLMLAGKRVMDRFRELMTESLDREDRELSGLLDEREERAHTTQTIIVAGGVASLGGAMLGGTLLMAGIVRRLRIVTENARRVAEGQDLKPVRGADEIAQLQNQLERSSRLLGARETELRQAKIEADRANQAKSDFISRMSHELRTPLNAILGFAQILREDAGEAAASDVRQILRAGRHLLSLINEVLDLSRIEAGQFAISLEPVAVGDVVEECIELMAPLAGQRQITIANKRKAEAGLHVLADRQRLKQVFLNLLSNAVKYNKDGGAVELSCRTENDKVRLVVCDTGPGISSDNIDQLFVPFARLGAETTEVEGTGLGLALSLRLMQMMEGDMGVSATGPGGSEFWLELNVADAVAAVTQEESVDQSPRHVPEGAIRILQVEDNPTNIRLLERIMGRRPNFELITVQEGNQAVPEAMKGQPALVLLDVNLPDISGREVLARLRAEPVTAHIPVIMLSADASPRQIEKLMSSGATAYVTKPLDVNHFLSVVDDVLALGATR